jgi:serine/threonine-protein kinase
MPASDQLLFLLAPPFAAAAWAIPVARHFYRLGVQVSKARAMGSYELLELIGKGGMGEVWSARHRMLARTSAIKLIRSEALLVKGGENAQLLLRRFEREARATAALRSPHTVELYDFGTSEDGAFYYVMELLEGLDLETLVQRFGPLPAGRVIYLLSQAAKSLAEAHEMGLVHRDVKPRNIFVCRMATEHDFIKVLDFGLVKFNAAESTQSCLTRDGVTTGTPAFMAPEVAMGRPDVDGRADLYSLGCVGYWLLTGQLVFEAENAMAIVIAHVQTPPVPPSQRTEMEVPGSLERVILQCLEKDPARRPETARRLLDLLAECEGAGAWTQKEAEPWWGTHLPRKGVYSAAAAGDELR